MHQAGSKHDSTDAGVDMLAMGGEEVCMGSHNCMDDLVPERL